MTPAPISVERLRELLAVMAGSDPNRMTDFPGGCDCHECGCIFIGGEGHDHCAQCEAKRQLLAALPEALPALLQQLAERDSELSALRQACWDARAVLGFDNDGDPTPDALVYPSLADLVRRDAAEFRKDYDEACNEAHAAERAREEAISIMRTHTRQRRGFVREVVIMDAAAVDAFLAASGGGRED